MNAPLTQELPESVQRALREVTLDDKYALEQGRAFMSGVQALVRLPLLQRQRDLLAGKNTAGFISGYRGSPLGGYDQALQAARKHLAANHVVFQPGVNEELAATALWGTQQMGFAPAGSNRYDGVFGIWYGKGPGVDRCSDVFKHANMAGTTPWGGVLAIAGDDHVAKSSTAAHQSDHIFKACGLPVFFPSSVQEVLDLGLHALAMSRFAGVWTSMKTIQEIVESSATVHIDPRAVQIVLPDFPMPEGGVHIRWPDTPLEQEARLFDHKWYAALAYVRANRLNRNIIEGPHDRLGLIASGKAYNDTCQALHDLGLSAAECQRLGIRLHKVTVVWPLEAQITRDFATGLREILVVEEKRQVIEYQLKEELYNWRADVRPRVLGKFNEIEGDFSGGEWAMPNPSANTLLRAKADLTPALIARAIATRLKALGVDADTAARLDARMAVLDAAERTVQQSLSTPADRIPWFCSGCPHNTSTRVPEGSRAMAGIGCHYMTVWMNRSTYGFTQMGGEGVPWVGQQPFSHEKHVFANLGDGTYFHSGLLAIRQSIAAGVNITYKVLYNDAVAMTGGQRVGERAEGHSVLQIVNSLRAEGVRKLTIVTDEPAKYDNAACTVAPGVVLRLPEGVSVAHRDRLDAIQREMREMEGTTIILYDQTCATEKRRRRKRGLMADPAVQVLINPEVCEGCGDCGVQSNCLSIEPLETPLGRKRTINASTCNKDYSCVKGFCPSFVTVHGGQRKKARKAEVPSPDSLGALPLPAPEPLQGSYGIVVAGVGGTGVITIGQLLGMAAHMEGKGIVTQDAAGLAQKGGATWSHVLLAPTQADILTTRVGTASADLVLACDPIVTTHKETVQRLRAGHTRVALNAHSAPTAAFVTQPDWHNPEHQCSHQIEALLGKTHVATIDADRAARLLLGDTLFINPFMLGLAWQKGWIALALPSLMRAMELNGVAVERNKQAFEWGRQAAHRPEAVLALLDRLDGKPTAGPAESVVTLHKKPNLDEQIETRVRHLTDYQNAAYAERYAQLVARVRQAERAFSAEGKPSLPLTEAVARYAFKLMAYKDEYEVARLHVLHHARIASEWEGDWSVRYHMAPPLLARHDEKGQPLKREYGPTMRHALRVLAQLKFLRGTALDIFGRSDERQLERQLVRDYVRTIERHLPTLNAERRDALLDFARLPERIRGYGPVKARHWQAVQAEWEAVVGAA